MALKYVFLLMIIHFSVAQCAELEQTPEVKARAMLASYASRVEKCHYYAYCDDRKLTGAFYEGAFYEGEICPLTVATHKYFFGKGPHTLMLFIKYPYFTDTKGTIHIVGLTHYLLRVAVYSKTLKILKGRTYEEELIEFRSGHEIFALKSRVYKDTTPAAIPSL